MGLSEPPPEEPEEAEEGVKINPSFSWWTSSSKCLLRQRSRIYFRNLPDGIGTRDLTARCAQEQFHDRAYKSNHQRRHDSLLDSGWIATVLLDIRLQVLLCQLQFSRSYVDGTVGNVSQSKTQQTNLPFWMLGPVSTG